MKTLLRIQEFAAQEFFQTLLLPRIAQSLRNIIDILLSYVLLSYVLLRYLTYLFYLVLLTQKNITGQK